MADYKKWEDMEFESDEDDCHPNIEINTWRRLKERQRLEKGIRKKEPVLVDKFSTTAVSRGAALHRVDHSDDKREEMTELFKEVTGVSLHEAKGHKAKEKTATASAAAAESDHTSKAADSTAAMSSAASSAVTADACDTAETAESAVESVKSSKTGIEAAVKEPWFEARSDPSKFLAENMKRLRKYAKISTEPKAHQFLRKRPFLIHEAAEGFLITFAVDRACEGARTPEIERLAMRCLYVHNLVEACKHRNTKPELCVPEFYRKMSHPKLAQEYAKELRSQQSELVQRISERREERLREVEEIDEETLDAAERAPPGPGGLDPTEVLNSLPASMQEAFLSRSVEALEEALLAMPKADAKLHMDKCIAAGLWEAKAGEELGAMEEEVEEFVREEDAEARGKEEEEEKAVEATAVSEAQTDGGKEPVATVCVDEVD